MSGLTFPRFRTVRLDFGRGALDVMGDYTPPFKGNQFEPPSDSEFDIQRIYAVYRRDSSEQMDGANVMLCLDYLAPVMDYDDISRRCIIKIEAEQREIDTYGR